MEQPQQQFVFDEYNSNYDQSKQLNININNFNQIQEFRQTKAASEGKYIQNQVSQSIKKTAVDIYSNLYGSNLEKENKFYNKLNELVSQQNVKSHLQLNILDQKIQNNAQRALNLHLEQLQKYSEAARNIDMNKLDDMLTKRNKTNLNSTNTNTLQYNHNKQYEHTSMADQITLKSSLDKNSISTSPFQINRKSKNQCIFSLRTMKTDDNMQKESTKSKIQRKVINNPTFYQRKNTLNQYQQDSNGPKEQSDLQQKQIEILQTNPFLNIKQQMCGEPEQQQLKNIQNETFNIQNNHSFIDIQNEQYFKTSNQNVQKPFQFISQYFKDILQQNTNKNITNRRNSQNIDSQQISFQKYEYRIKNISKSPITIKKEIQRLHIEKSKFNSNQKTIKLLDFNENEFQQNLTENAIDIYQNKQSIYSESLNITNDKGFQYTEEQKQKYLIIDSPEKLIQILDLKINQDKQNLKTKTPDLIEQLKFVEKRLKKVLNYGQIQHDNNQNQEINPLNRNTLINCSVKQKILRYLKGKDERCVPPFSQDKYKNEILRKQLKFTEMDQNKKHKKISSQQSKRQSYKKESQTQHQCSHFETLQGIISKEELLYQQYLKFVKSVYSQQIKVTQKQLVKSLLNHFYDIDFLSESEKMILENPVDFQLFLTSPWVRLIKDQSEKDLFNNSNEEKDILSSIKNNKMKELVKLILELYIQAGNIQQCNDVISGNNIIKLDLSFTNEDVTINYQNYKDQYSKIRERTTDSSKLIQTAKTLQENSNKQIYENKQIQNNTQKENEQEKMIKLATKNLQQIFKDQNIRIFQQMRLKTTQTEYSARSFDDQANNPCQYEQDFTTQQIEIPFFPQQVQKYESSFNNLINQQKLFEIGKNNYNFLHSGFQNDNEESQMLFEYILKQNEMEFNIPEYKQLQDIKLKNVQNDYQKYGGEFRNKKMGMAEYLELYPPLYQCQFDSTRKIPLYPTVQNFWNGYRKRFEIIGLENVEKLNCVAIGEFMQNLPIAELHIQYSKLSDFQLSQILNGVAKNGKYQYLWSLSIIGDNIGNLELGNKSIDSIIQILKAKQDHKNINIINQYNQQVKDSLNLPSMQLNLQKIQSFEERNIKIQRLAVLSLKGLKMVNKDFEHFLKFITFENQMQSLQYLQISQQHQALSSSSSKNKIFQIILELILQQRCLKNLDLSQNQMSFNQMEALINICNQKLQKGLQKLNLSGNSLRKAEIENDSQQKQKMKKKVNFVTSIQLIQQILENGKDLTDLDISGCDIDWKQMFELSKSIQNSPCLRSFKISCLDGFCDQDEQSLHQFRSLFFQAFGINWSYNLLQQSLEQKTDLLVKTDFFLSQEEQVLRNLLVKNQSKNNRKLIEQKLQFNNGIFEFQRRTNFCEHIFKNVQTIEDEMFEFDINLKWQMKTSYQIQDQIAILIIFDRKTINLNHQTEWKEIPLDFEILNKIKYEQTDQSMRLPLIITQDNVQPLIPARFFTLFNFLGNFVDQYGNNFNQDPQQSLIQQIFETIKTIKQGFTNSIYHKVMKRKVFDVEKQRGQKKIEEIEVETEKSICSEIRNMHKILTQKCDGWFQYMQQTILDNGTSEYSQVIGLTNEAYNQLVQRQTKIEMEEADVFYKKQRFEIRDEDFYASSLFLKPLLKEHKIILFDPAHIQDSQFENPVGKMYIWQGIIKRKDAFHQKMELFKQQNQQIQTVPNILQRPQNQI